MSWSRHPRRIRGSRCWYIGRRTSGVPLHNMKENRTPHALMSPQLDFRRPTHYYYVVQLHFVLLSRVTSPGRGSIHSTCSPLLVFTSSIAILRSFRDGPVSGITRLPIPSALPHSA